MVEALEAVEPVGDRGRTMTWGDTVLVADCYNSNPGSVEVALQSLAAREVEGLKIAVLGDMLELGPREMARRGRPPCRGPGADRGVALRG